jgi:regulator of sigma E protease
MNTILQSAVSILEFVVALGVLIFLHEFGHYIFSKIFGIQVEEFGFGFPPRMLKLFRLGETDFTLNWIPFGAFVRPKGENDPTVPGGMASAAPWKRFMILVGGPLFNITTAILLFATVFSLNYAPKRWVVVINSVEDNSPAFSSGMQQGDIILSAQNTGINDTDQLKHIVGANLGKNVSMVIRRAGQDIPIQIVPRVNPPKGQGALGIVMSNPVVPVNWFQALPYASYEVYYQAKTLVNLPGMLIRGEVPADQARMVGPVGMKTIFDTVVTEDQKNQQKNPGAAPLLTLNFLAVISAALGITNLLPLPALDGGRIIFVLPELFFRKRVPAEMENMVHLIGFAALIILMVVITAQDIINPIQLR